jgi:competence protein ComEA
MSSCSPRHHTSARWLTMRSAFLLAMLLAAAVAPCGALQTSPGVKSSPTRQRAGSAAVEPLDINTATVEQLKVLPGFGLAYARRVIAGRPYTSKNQLVTRGVIPAAAYSRVAPLIVAHRLHRE